MDLKQQKLNAQGILCKIVYLSTRICELLVYTNYTFWQTNQLTILKAFNKILLIYYLNHVSIIKKGC